VDKGNGVIDQKMIPGRGRRGEIASRAVGVPGFAGGVCRPGGIAVFGKFNDIFGHLSASGSYFAVSPEKTDRVIGKHTIFSDYQQPFFNGLTDQQSVKRVTVVFREACYPLFFHGFNIVTLVEAKSFSFLVTTIKLYV